LMTCDCWAGFSVSIAHVPPRRLVHSILVAPVKLLSVSVRFRATILAIILKSDRLEPASISERWT
jgi:hypothetical protein